MGEGEDEIGSIRFRLELTGSLKCRSLARSEKQEKLDNKKKGGNPFKNFKDYVRVTSVLFHNGS